MTAASTTPFFGNAALLTRAFQGEDVTALAAQCIERATANPDDAHALMDLSTLLQIGGKRELALTVQAQALQIQQRYCLSAARGPALRLLALMAPGDLTTNAPLDFLLNGSDVALDMLYIAPELPFPDDLPPYDLIFVAVGESDATRPILQGLEEFARDCPLPLLNPPARIALTSRDDAFQILSNAPGVLMPRTIRLTREQLDAIARGEASIVPWLEDGDFPLIVRPIGSHAGHGLARVDVPGDLPAYLAAQAEAAFYVSRFIDYASADGQFRKYRVVLIDGVPYAGHMAISSHWMIHYLNAGMTDNPAKRDEEARFMAEFDTGFARRHAIALTVIAERCGLHYLVIDCGETREGELLVFETDTGAVIHDMDPEAVFPYKQTQMRKVFDAFRAMLGRAVGHSG